jgi:hypothetical protein
MEIVRHWREIRVNSGFTGKVSGAEIGMPRFKYPGGSVSLSGTCEEIYLRFEEKGFKPQVIERILLRYFNSVATKSTVSSEKVINCDGELLGGEVWE